MGTEAAEPDTRPGWTWKDAPGFVLLLWFVLAEEEVLEAFSFGGGSARHDQVPSKESPFGCFCLENRMEGPGEAVSGRSQEVRNGAGKRGTCAS